MRRVAVVAAAVAASMTLTGCLVRRSDQRPPTVVVETRFLDELSAAIDGVNRARGTVANDASALGAAAAAIDDVDDAAVDGDRAAARARRAAAANVVRKGRAVARRLGRDVRAYQRAITALADASTAGLDPAQRAAITNVVSAARAEYARLRGYATVVASVWPRYERLDQDQALWLSRYNGGWYRDSREAGGAYVVMTDRAALARDRRSLAGADRRRIAAAKAVDAEIATARSALAALAG